MARRRRYGRRRRFNRVRKYQAYSRTGRRSQGRQIYKLQRQITAVRRKVRANTEWTQWKYQNGDDTITHGLAPESTWQPYVWELTNPAAWSPCFQTGTPQLVQSVFRGRSMGLEYMVQQNEIGDDSSAAGDPCTVSIFIVKLKKETAKQFLNQSANGTVLVHDTHFVQTDMGLAQGEGMVMLNKGIFDIIHLDRFIIGAQTTYFADTQTTNLRDNNHRRYKRLPYRNVIKSGTITPWKNMGSNQLESTDRVFLYMFHNAWGTPTREMQLSFNANLIITGRSTV